MIAAGDQNISTAAILLKTKRTSAVVLRDGHEKKKTSTSITSLFKAEALRISPSSSIAFGHKRACHGSTFQLSKRVLSTIPSCATCSFEGIVSRSALTLFPCGGNCPPSKLNAPTEFIQSTDPRESLANWKDVPDSLLIRRLPSSLKQEYLSLLSSSSNAPMATLREGIGGTIQMSWIGIKYCRHPPDPPLLGWDELTFLNPLGERMLLLWVCPRFFVGCLLVALDVDWWPPLTGLSRSLIQPLVWCDRRGKRSARSRPRATKMLCRLLRP